MTLTIEYKLCSDHLYYLAAGSLSQSLGSGTGVIFDIILQNPALDEFPRLQGVVGLFNEVEMCIRDRPTSVETGCYGSCP